MAPAHCIRILLVDDHSVVRMGLAAVLSLDEGLTVVAEAEGHEKDEALHGFIASSEFYDQVFSRIVSGQSWNIALFKGDVTQDICSWISSTFELDEEQSAKLSRAFSWPTALSSIFSNRKLAARIAPYRILEHLGEYQLGLENIESKIDEEVELISESEFFDKETYCTRYCLNFKSDKDAARHYLLIGFKRGYKPNLNFNTSYYLATHSDVRESGKNPLVHYLLYGGSEKRATRMGRSFEAESPLAPPKSEWTKLVNRGAALRHSERAEVDSPDSVDIIIPVYRGINDTLACIYSVLTAENLTPYRLLVIDDKSPDPELSRSLDHLAHLGLITLIKNDQNLGFVGTVNRGMRLSQKRDVILLNSDTEVFGNWIDRLRDHATASDRIATVTPLSNNATIFSYPFYARSNSQRLELPFPEIDQIASNVNRGLSCTVPTGVGFCFYIRRAALDDIGIFNETLFGKGYGEENDFCMRAIAHAWDNLAAFDVFVRHTGEVSFGNDAQQGQHNGYQRLIKAHPRYDALIGKFIERDPFACARTRIDIARFAAMSGGSGVLMIEHGWGGGIEHHVGDLTKLLDHDGIQSLVCTPSADRTEGALRHLLNDDFPNLPKLVWADLEETANTLKSLNLARVHIHSVVGLEDQTVTSMMQAIAAAGLEYDFTVHDYAPVCPRITMIDWSGGYCSSPSAEFCRTCIARVGTPFGQVDIDEWRTRYKLLLNGARKIIVPDDDVVQRLLDYVDILPDVIIRPHPIPEHPTPHPPRQISKGIRKIGIIGAISEAKGSRILRMMCADAIERKLPIEFVLYGFTDSPERDIFPNLTVTGIYRDADFGELVTATPCDMALYLSVWPETFSYTLDHAFNNAIYPVAFDIGAIARRIRETGFGEIIPLDYMYDVALLNNVLIAMKIPTAPKRIVERRRAWSSARAYYDTDSHAVA